MAKHKSATEVTIVNEEKSAFELWVLRNWPKAAVVGVIVAAGIVFFKTRADATEAARGEEWNQLAKPDGNLAEYQAASARVAGTPLEGWARLLEAQRALSEDDVEGAAKAAQALAGLDGHLLNSLSLPIGPDGAEMTPGQTFAKKMQAHAEWDAAHASILSNAAPPADAPRVTIQTGEGDIVVALYQDLAPEHVANFLAVAKEDGYDGTKFYRAVNNASSSLIEGGDPNTREEDATNWGRGGDDKTLEQEKNGLIHAPGYLAMARSSTGAASSGMRFYLTFGRSHFLDGQSTIFGKVVEGLDVIKEIGTAPLLPADPQTRVFDRPEAPVTINDVVVAE